MNLQEVRHPNDIGTIEVENPEYVIGFGNDRRVHAVRSLRDPLAKLHHTNRIDEAEYRAGRKMQALLEAAAVGHVRGVDPSREPVDGGGHVPDIMSDRQLAALKMLAPLWPMLGLDGSALVRSVCAGGVMPEDYARQLGYRGSRDVNAMGRIFKWHLSRLALRFGLAS